MVTVSFTSEAIFGFTVSIYRYDNLKKNLTWCMKLRIFGEKNANTDIAQKTEYMPICTTLSIKTIQYCLMTQTLINIYLYYRRQEMVRNIEKWIQNPKRNIYIYF